MMTHVGEENTWNTTPSVDTLFVALLFVGTARKTSLVAGNGVLMCLDAALVVALNGRAQELVVLRRPRGFLFPAKGQVSGRDHLDEVHEVEGLLIGDLIRVVEWVDVMASPAARTGVLVLLLHVCDDSIAQLRSEAQVVDLVRKSMRVLVLEVVVQVVYVHVASRERLSGGNVEIADNLVDFDASLETASFLSLSVEVFGIVLALALLHALATTKRPRYRGVCVADIVAGITAAGFGCVGRGRCAVAVSAVIGGKVFGFVFVPDMTLAPDHPYAHSNHAEDRLTSPKPLWR
jgi:hypothetical protein